MRIERLKEMTLERLCTINVGATMRQLPALFPSVT